MSAFILPEQSVCIKSVPEAMLKRVLDAVSKQETRAKLGVRFVIDKDPECAGMLLVYANYASACEAVCARDSLEAWARQQPGGHLVMLKSDMCNQIYFALYVANTPTGTTPAELEHVFAKYGPLHKSRGVCAIKETEFFINFKTYAGAEAALQAAERGALRFEGSILTANAARNTKYINNLIHKMRAERQYSFSMEDARRVGEETTDWPPQPRDVEALLKAAPQHFVHDCKNKCFLVIDRNAPISPAVAPPRSVPRPCSPEAKSEERAYLNSMNGQVYGSIGLLHQLFLRLWYDVKGVVWTDSDGLLASISAEQLKEELGYQMLPPGMLQPIQDWELRQLATALTATSLKARLNGIIVRLDSRDVDATYARYMTLVNDKLISHEDLQNKYGCTFVAARSSAAQAVQTVRFVLNIMSRRSGVCAVTLSAACCTCLRDLISEALSTLSAALLDLKQPATESLCGEYQSNMSLETGSTCSSNCTEVAAEGVEQWGVEQVLSFFEQCKFPTAGVMAGEVDGMTLLSLFQDDDAEAIFTEQTPEGMGFSRLLFKGRFKKEMANLTGRGECVRAKR